MSKKLILLLVGCMAGCTTVQVPPRTVMTKAEFRAVLLDTSLPMKERQRMWQVMKKCYPEGVGEE